ncbi:MAG: hypothetical protein HYY23_10300 [Verrucomicrobia bacterium]|nr:hypothetical protein [Verrucomicrobiota bacterium]
MAAVPLAFGYALQARRRAPDRKLALTAFGISALELAALATLVGVALARFFWP